MRRDEAIMCLGLVEYHRCRRQRRVGLFQILIMPVGLANMPRSH